MKKKIGIITFFNNRNYGSSLQAFALMSYLQSIGYDASIVDYTDNENPANRKLRRRTYTNRLLTGLLHPFIIPEMLKGKSVALKSTERDDDIINIYKEFNSHQLKITPMNNSMYDAFICGSDQVWKIDMPGLHEVFFLRFTERKKKISYAASLGTKEIPSYNFRRLRKYLSDFSAISVREDDSVIVLKDRLGIDAIQVLDPVLLVGKGFWENIVASTHTYSDKYIVCYFLDRFDDSVDFIIECSRKYSAEIIIVKSNEKVPERLKDIALTIQPDPLEFANLIHNSTLVITDSFHGTAFSILFHRLFWTIPRNYLVYDGQSNRIESLLRLTGLEFRLYSSNTESDNNDNVDFDYSDEKLALMRQRSISFLNHALNEV